MAAHIKNISRTVARVSKSLKRTKGIVKSAYIFSGCCFSKASDEKPFVRDERCSNEIHIVTPVENETISHQPHSLSGNENPVHIEVDFEPPVKRIKCEDNEFNPTLKEQSSTRQTSNISVTQIFESDIGQCKKSPFEDLESDRIGLPAEECEPKNKSKKFKTNHIEPKKQRPNYFIAIKISDSQIHEALKSLQNHMLEQEKKILSSLIQLNTLHITLMVMHIPDIETHARALKVLHTVHEAHDNDLSNNPLHLEFKGLSNFQNKVLYAQLSQDDGYERLLSLQKSVVNSFALASIKATDTKEGFTPHLTVAKIKFQKKAKFQLKKINPSLYKSFTSHYFGIQTVEGIQLLNMCEKEKKTGYYVGDELLFSAFKSTDLATSQSKPSISKSIEDKKKEVKGIIHELTKEKLGMK